MIDLRKRGAVVTSVGAALACEERTEQRRKATAFSSKGVVVSPSPDTQHPTAPNVGHIYGR